MPPILCLYLLYGPYARLLTHKKVLAAVSGVGTKRFRIFCAAVTSVMLAAGAADKAAFVMSGAYRGSDTAGSIVSIIAIVCLFALAAACVAYIVKNSVRGRRASVFAEAARGLLFPIGAGFLLGSIEIGIFTDEITIRALTSMNGISFLTGALIIIVTSAAAKAAERRVGRADGEPEK